MIVGILNGSPLPIVHSMRANRLPATTTALRMAICFDRLFVKLTGFVWAVDAATNERQMTVVAKMRNERMSIIFDFLLGSRTSADAIYIKRET